MSAQPEIQGVHQHVELKQEEQVFEPAVEPSNLEQDESDLLGAEGHQTETIEGSQVACAFSRMDQERINNSRKEEKSRTVKITISAVLVLVGSYAALVLLI